MTGPLSPEYREELRQCHSDYAELVFDFVYRLTRWDKALAEDLTHEVFLETAEHWGEWRLVGNRLPGLLLTVARHKAIDVFRHNDMAKAKLPAVYERRPPVETDPYEQAMDAIVDRQLHKVLRALPYRLYLVVVLRWWLGWKNKQIAAELGVTAGRVTQLRQEAEDILRAELAPYVADDWEGGT